MLGKKRDARKKSAGGKDAALSDNLSGEMTLPVLRSKTFETAQQTPLMSAQTLSEMHNIGVMVFDPDNNLVEINSNVHSLLDLEPDTFTLGQNLEQCIQAIGTQLIATKQSKQEQAAGLYNLITKQMERGRGFKHANLVLSDERHSEFRISRSETGFLTMTCRDVTARETNLAYLDVGSRLLSSGYWTYSFATGKTKFSDYVRSRLSENDLVKVDKNGLFGLIHKEDLATLMEPWSRTIQTGETFDATYRIVTELDGLMWQRTVGEVQYDGAGNKIRFTGFVTDITADVQLREDLTGAQDLARSKNEFVARMSHEIKTPLNAIVGMADAIAQDEMSEDLRECVEHIMAAAQDLDSILSDAIEHAKLSQGEIVLRRDNVDVRSLIATLKTKWVQACRAKGIKLLTKIDEAVPEFVVSDAKRLSANLDSLISNAVKFTDSGTIKLIAATKTGKENKRELVFALRDSGCGMDEETLKTVFLPLGNNSKTRERTAGGIGLGMANTKARIEAMGGHILVKSAPGEGTTCIMSLPLSETSSEKLTDEPVKFTEPMVIKPDAFETGDGSDPDISRLSILCVEDSLPNQAVVRKMIGNDVRTLIFAPDGLVALECLTMVRFDAILMDIHMPVMDGIEATMKIRSSGKAWADTPIIAMTADPNYTQKRLYKNIGMDDHIAKPFKRSDIIEKITPLLDAAPVEAEERLRA